MPSWTAAEATQWEAELQARLAATKCERCGSNKVTQTLRGRPYMAYVDWYVPRESKWPVGDYSVRTRRLHWACCRHNAKSEELGWKTLSLSGCTEDGQPTCVACGAAWKKAQEEPST